MTGPGKEIRGTQQKKKEKMGIKGGKKRAQEFTKRKKRPKGEYVKVGKRESSKQGQKHRRTEKGIRTRRTPGIEKTRELWGGLESGHKGKRGAKKNRQGRG